jgi:hypothetical protein
MPDDAEPRHDPRTRQFLELVTASVGLMFLHIASFMLAGRSIVSTNYAIWACIALPFLALVVAVMLVVAGRWHWGQSILFMILALIFSFIQLMLVGEASAAV